MNDIAHSAAFCAGLELARAVVLRMFHGGFPEAQVSGGYLRDLHLGRAPKDIDVFIARRDVLPDTLERMLSRALAAKVATQFDLSYTEDSEIHRVFCEVDDTGSLPIQVIELADGHDPAERFKAYDFGLCQATLGQDGVVRRSQAFMQDLARQTCTLISCESAVQHARSMRRWDRWKADLVPMGYRLIDETEWAALPA